jgi:hypothetical protein
MNAEFIAMSASLVLNLLLIWKLIDASYHKAILRADIDYWRDSAGHWCKLFDDLRRNSVPRDPKTGRLIKKGY